MNAVVITVVIGLLFAVFTTLIAWLIVFSTPTTRKRKTSCKVTHINSDHRGKEYDIDKCVKKTVTHGHGFTKITLDTSKVLSKHSYFRGKYVWLNVYVQSNSSVSEKPAYTVDDGSFYDDFGVDTYDTDHYLTVRHVQPVIMGDEYVIVVKPEIPEDAELSVTATVSDSLSRCPIDRSSSLSRCNTTDMVHTADETRININTTLPADGRLRGQFSMRIHSDDLDKDTVYTVSEGGSYTWTTQHVSDGYMDVKMTAAQDIKGMDTGPTTRVDSLANAKFYLEITPALPTNAEVDSVHVFERTISRGE